jgi:Phage gp6-like head-tail connector protein
MSHARRSLTLLTAPAVEPVIVPDAVAWLRLDDSSDSAVLTQLIIAARQAAEEYLRRSLITQTWKLTLDLVGTPLENRLEAGTYNLPITALYGGLYSRIELPKPPVQSITSVVTYDLSNTSSTYDPSNYFLDTAGQRLCLNFGSIWPSNLRRNAAAEVTFKTGYGDDATTVPQAIKTGLLIHVASLYEQRGQCADAMDIPPGARQLYNQYRVMGERRG